MSDDTLETGKGSGENVAMIAVLVIVLAAIIFGVFIWLSNNKTNNTFSDAESSNNVSGNIAASKALISRINNYSSLPAASRQTVVDSLVKSCKNSANVVSATVVNATSNSISLNLTCKNGTPTSLQFTNTNGTWTKSS